MKTVFIMNTQAHIMKGNRPYIDICCQIFAYFIYIFFKERLKQKWAKIAFQLACYVSLKKHKIYILVILFKTDSYKCVTVL